MNRSFVGIVLLAACSIPPGQSMERPDPGTSSGAFSLAVVQATYPASIGVFRPATGRYFVALELQLTNQGEETPLPIGQVNFSIATDRELVVLASSSSAVVSNPCPADVAVSRGGSLTCRLAFEVPLQSEAIQLRYVDPLHQRTAEADIAPRDQTPSPALAACLAFVSRSMAPLTSSCVQCVGGCWQTILEDRQHCSESEIRCFEVAGLSNGDPQVRCTRLAECAHTEACFEEGARLFSCVQQGCPVCYP